MRFLLSVILLSVLLSSCEEHVDHARFLDGRVMVGDNKLWAEPSFDDQSWPSYLDTFDREIIWERMPVEIPDHEDYRYDNVIMIGATANFDAYFDGVYIGNNTGLEEGTVTQKPGYYQTNFLIPDSLNTIGEHLVAMRYHRVNDDQGFHSFSIIGNHTGMLRVPLQISKFMFLFAGMYLIIGISYLLMFFSNSKNHSLIIFSLICFLYFSLLMFEYLKLFYQYSYSFQNTRMEIIAWLNMAVAFFIPCFFSLHFSFPWKKILFALMGAIIIGMYMQSENGDYDDMAKYHNLIMWFFSFVILGYAAFKKQSYALIPLAGLVLAFSIVLWLPKFFFPFVSAFDISLFVSFAVLILSILITSSLKRKEDRKAYEDSILQSEKLKTELLKKNIRPHFIMNTLTSMMDWVEESPKEGVKFIGSLAEEFEILNEIADHKLVPITQEINLCKSHLRVMGYRKEVKYLWEEHGIDPNEIIPPAIIHTIIENGITHSIANERGEVKFKLSFEKDEKFKKYTIQTFAGNRKKNDQLIEGTGTKYIKSRLKESYAEAWELISHATDSGWETVIKIKL